MSRASHSESGDAGFCEECGAALEQRDRNGQCYDCYAEEAGQAEVTELLEDLLR